MKYYYFFIYILMLAFAGVQYNDPDAFHWIIAYIFVGFVHFLRYKKKISNLNLILIAIPYILWGIDLFPPQWEGLLLNETGMKTLNIEFARESMGLTLVAFILILTSFLDKN